MNQFNRRDFVFLSSGAALGNMGVSGLASADEVHNTVMPKHIKIKKR